MITAISCGEKEESVSKGELTAPPDVALTASTSTSLPFSWTAIAAADRYSARLEASSISYAKSSTVTEPTVTFSNLTEGVEYTFKVRSLSGSDYTDYSTAITATPGVSSASGSDSSSSDSTTSDDTTSDVDATSYYSEFLIPSVEEDLGALAFPGAEGGGMYVTGGRGGTVYHVTTLDDDSSNTGSLRYALVKCSGPRIIVFDVCGTIYLKSTMKVTNGDVTVAGQTAPGDGICIANETVNIQADNVIIRFLRFRVGNENSSLSDGSDAIWGRYNSNIILDHCTMSWSIDELGSFYANKNFTMQWCMLAEALNNSGFHSKSGHGYAGLWGGKNASFHHNLMANNYSRNARIDHPGIYSSYLNTHRGNVDYRNNVIYNWGDNHTYGGEDGYFNIVGNYYKPGPASKTRSYIVDAYWYNSSSTNTSSEYPYLYMEGNTHTGGVSSSYSDGVLWHDQSSTTGTSNPSHSDHILSTPLSILADDVTPTYVTTHSASDAYTQLLSYVGCSLSRDAFDTRIASETQNAKATYGDNGILDNSADAGGWPELSATSTQISKQATDTDGDGMPDWFEEQFGLNKSSASDAKAYSIDPKGRYTNLDMYLHYLVKDIVAAQNTNGTYTSLE